MEGFSNEMKGVIEEWEKEGKWESRTPLIFSVLFLLEVNILLYRKPEWQEKILKFWRSGSNWKVVFYR